MAERLGPLKSEALARRGDEEACVVRDSSKSAEIWENY